MRGTESSGTIMHMQAVQGWTNGHVSSSSGPTDMMSCVANILVVVLLPDEE